MAGVAGATGPSGVAGATGASGLAGATGPSGATGAAGATGASGVAGATGPSGATGAVGATGASGVAGATGASGVAGAVGATGPSGATGASGAQGNSGVAGVTGASGATGPAPSGTGIVTVNSGVLGTPGPLTGDVTTTGSGLATTVVAIRGTSVSATAPTSGQVLEYNGTTWIPTTPNAGTVTGIGTVNYLPKWTSTSALSSTSLLYDDGTHVGINNSSPAAGLDLIGYQYVRDAATATSGLKFAASGGVNYIESAGASMSGSADLNFTNMNAANTWMVIKNTTGYVGIGTSGSPANLLSVGGTTGNFMVNSAGIVFLPSNPTVASPVAGSIRWNATSNDFEGYDGTRWVSLTGLQDKTMMFTKDN